MTEKSSGGKGGKGSGRSGSGRSGAGRSGRKSTTGKSTAGKSAARSTSVKSGSASKAASAAGGATRRSSTRTLRRPPTGGLALFRYRLRMAWRGVLERPLIWLSIFVVAGAWLLLPQRLIMPSELEAGDIARRTWIADRDLSVIDEAATGALEQRARSDVLPVYDLDLSLEAEKRRQLGELFAAGRELVAATPAAEEGKPARATENAGGEDPGEDSEAKPDPLGALTERLSNAAGFRISEEAAAVLLARSFQTELEDRLGGVLTRLLRLGVVADKGLLLEHRERGITLRQLPSGLETRELDLFRFLDYPGEVRDEVSADLRAWDDLRARERRALGDLLMAAVAPNLNFNSSATLELRRGAAESVGSVAHTFGKGEVIVRKGARIDDLQVKALGQLAGERDLRALVMAAAGAVLLLGAAALLVWLAARHERREDRSCERLLGENLILLILHIAGVRLAIFVAEALGAAIAREPLSSTSSYLFAIPFAALALLTLLLYGRDLALVLSLVFSLIAGRLAGGEMMWEMSVFCLVSCLAAVFALDHLQFRQRSWMMRAASVIALVNACSVLVLQLVDQRLEDWSRLGFDIFCGAVGGLLAAVVASFTVPLFESLFGLTTTIKLIELANPNLPLLRRLALEAPGTFQHSLAVANLAKAGAEAIDGDAILVHTGALYHDIGKVFRPQYFIENQPPGRNPHDKIQPSMSALILINHVKEGLELAETYALPAPIHDAIEQHHGTRLIKFFYNRAKERADPDTGEPSEDEFRYSGPKPQSKEMGVLMLADAVEAASRTLVEPSRQKIRSVLRAIFDDCLVDGQLEMTSLTLGDLKKVEAAFQRVLDNIHHRRVDYPGFDFNKGKGSKVVEATPPAGPPGEPAREAS